MTKSIFRYFHSYSILLLQETVSKKNAGRIDMINAYLILISNLLKYFLALLHQKQISKIKHSSPDFIQKCIEKLICEMCFF